MEDSIRRSEGAEFLVIGHLLLANICSLHSDDPDYDLLAYSRQSSGQAKIRVTSRWAEDYDQSFPLSGFEYDFVVHAALNMGFRFHNKGKRKLNASETPEYYVLPVDIVRAAEAKNRKPNTVILSDIPNVLQYRNNWCLIESFVRQHTVIRRPAIRAASFNDERLEHAEQP